MTRETKIGLLVGLAFIIVVGILLSEHLTSATERPAAQLAEAGHGVRAGVTAPGTPGLDNAAPLRAAEPQQPVLTAHDLPPAAPAATKVVIGAPTPVQTVPQSIVVKEQSPIASPMIEGPMGPVSTQSPLVSRPSPVIVTDPFANDPIAKAAKEHGEVVVPVDAKSPLVGLTPNTPTTGAREYKAQAGDTLSRMAALLPGGATRANRDAIVKLNPTLQKDANKVVSGRTYLLPNEKPISAGAAVVVAKPVEKPAVKPTPVVAEAPRPIDGQRTYVVKAGDTLTKIAVAELGSKSQVSALKELNEDVLKGGDAIRVDMKLKLPPKSIASVQ